MNKIVHDHDIAISCTHVPAGRFCDRHRHWHALRLRHQVRVIVDEDAVQQIRAAL